MNECSIVRDLLPLYIDGETTPETAAFIKEHLSGCEECKKVFGSDCRIPHAMEDSSSRGNYQFSTLKSRIASDNFKKLAIIAAAGLAIGCAAGYILSNSEK